MTIAQNSSVAIRSPKDIFFLIYERVATTLLVAGSTLIFWIPGQTPFASTSSYNCRRLTYSLFQLTHVTWWPSQICCATKFGWFWQCNFYQFWLKYSNCQIWLISNHWFLPNLGHFCSLLLLGDWKKSSFYQTWGISVCFPSRRMKNLAFTMTDFYQIWVIFVHFY